MTDPTISGSESKPRTFGPVAFVGVAIGIALAIAKAMVWSGGDFTAEVLGYALGSAALPMLIAYAIAGRKKVWNPNLLSFSFCGMCLLLLLMEVRAHPVSWKTHVADIVRETAGTKALSSDETSADPEMDAILRGILQDMVKIRQARDTEVARFSIGIDEVYSPESFSSPTEIRQTLGAVNGVLAADKEFSVQFAQWQEQVEGRVNRSSMSDQKKQDFLKGFRRSLGDSEILRIREEIMRTETRWAGSVSDLYGFASSNTAKFLVSGSEIVVTDQNVKEQFDRKLKNSQEIRSDLQRLNSRLLELQREGMKQFGLTPEDLRLKDRGSQESQ
jgi:hypothetical protein